MEGCLFCGIAQGKIPSYKVYEDEQFFASLDINPANPGHLIVFPKAHYQTIMEMSEQEYCKYFTVIRAISLSLLEYGAQGINFLYAMGETAGQRSPHLITHIIPRYAEDKVNLIWQPQKYTQEQFQQIQQKIMEKIHGAQQPPSPQQPPPRGVTPQLFSPQQQTPPLQQPSPHPQTPQPPSPPQPEEEKVYQLKRRTAEYW